jgi:predicted Zn-dependent protease
VTTSQNSYRATVFHPSLGGRNPIGCLRVKADGVWFEAEEIKLNFALATLQLRAGGHNGEQLFLEGPDQPGWLVTSSDRSVLDDLALVATAGLREQIAAARKQRVSSAKLYLVAAVAVGVLAGLVVLVLGQRSRLAEAAVRRIPVEWEVQFGESVFATVRQRSRLIEEPRWTAEVAAATGRLLAGITNAPYEFRFHVVEEPTLNAFALPGGHVVIHTGLLQAVRRPEELAGVLAHEMAHVTRRHSLRKLVETAGLSLLVRALVGDPSGLLGALTDSSELLFRQKFSRDFEREADDTGWDYLVAARIDPRGMIEFFRKLRDQQSQSAAGAVAEGRLSFLSTHPATAERIARLEARWRQLAADGRFEPLPIAPTRP